MIIEKYDWKFDIDIQKTKLLYENRLDNIINKDKQLSELTNFFYELGIDIEKPDSYDSDFSEAIYTCIGRAYSKNGYEIDMYEKNQFISIVIYNEDNIVTLEVFGIK